jgi:MoaA/NifB/PqqE/SkfB family radical SAM enzyme
MTTAHTNNTNSCLPPRPRDKYENLLLSLLEQHNGVEEVWSYPVGLVLDPSSVCQLHCPCCINSLSPPIRTRTIMDWELFKKIIDEIGRYLFKVWLFNWGEPFLNKRLVDMVSLLKSCGSEVAISSHLSMPISEDTVNALIDLELDCLTASIDGMTQESYSKYRRKGDVSIALANMKRFAEAKRKRNAVKPHIDWQYLVFSFNERELPAAHKFAKEIGAVLRPAAPYVNIETMRDWLSTKDEYVMDIYKRAPKGNEQHAAAIAKQGIEDRLGELSRKYYKGCDWHYLISAINANGNVSPCCGIMLETEDFGSLATESFRSVWNNRKYREARLHMRPGCHSHQPADNVCLRCSRAEIMGYGQDIVRQALINSPSDVVEKAKRLLPNHPLIREITLPFVRSLYGASQSIKNDSMKRFVRKAGKRILAKFRR